MFNKKTCKNCKAKINKNNSFCPYCGTYLSPYKYNPKKSKSNEKEDFGMLGENDEMQNNSSQNPMLGGFSGKVFSKVLNSTMKMLEKEMQKSMKEPAKISNNPNTHFELYINGKRVNPNNIKVTQRPLQQVQKVQNKRHEKNTDKFLSSEDVEKFSKLPIEEPKSNLRRLSDKIIYEISVPGVKSINNVSILKIGNSIEIKAVSNKNAYMKVIPFSMNILKYELLKETIVLELKE